MRLSNTKTPEFNASSMADIAFLMLIFFMVTTTLKEEKGLTLFLPPIDNVTQLPVHERNVFNVQINSFDELLVEGEHRASPSGLRKDVIEFVLNRGKNPHLSDDPQHAIVSLKTDRGTSYNSFIEALDEIQAAYYEIYADQAGISVGEFRELDIRDPSQQALYEKGRAGIPMGISLAEPTHITP